MSTLTYKLSSQLGLFEGSDAAWENADYHSTLEALRKEFEIESRFNDISMKLDLVKDNARYAHYVLNYILFIHARTGSVKVFDHSFCPLQSTSGMLSFPYLFHLKSINLVCVCVCVCVYTYMCT